MAWKPTKARMGGVYGYIIWKFAKAPQISSPSAATTRSSLYETRSLSCWTSHHSRSRHLSRQPAAPAASGPRIPCRYPATLSYENSSIKEQISTALLQMSHCFWAFTPLTNAASVFHAAQPCASIPGMYADLFRILSNAVEELGLEWFPSVEQSRSRLDEWFLPGRHQAPRQRASPFFPNVHDEINKSCREPYSSHLRVSSSSALTSVDGAEEKGYDSLPPLDESVAAHICLPTAIGKSLPAV